MSSTEIAAPPPLPLLQRPPRTWYFLGSTIAVLIAYAALNLAHMVVIIAVVVRHGDLSISGSELQELAKGGPMAAGTILACPLVLAVLCVTIRIARRRFAEYLAPEPAEPRRTSARPRHQPCVSAGVGSAVISDGACAAGLRDRQLPDGARAYFQPSL
jgi:hypothetical protein